MDGSDYGIMEKKKGEEDDIISFPMSHSDGLLSRHSRCAAAGFPGQGIEEDREGTDARLPARSGGRQVWKNYCWLTRSVFPVRVGMNYFPQFNGLNKLMEKRRFVEILTNNQEAIFHHPSSFAFISSDSTQLQNGR